MLHSIFKRANSTRNRLISICSTRFAAQVLVSVLWRWTLTQLNSVWSTTLTVRAAPRCFGRFASGGLFFLEFARIAHPWSFRRFRFLCLNWSTPQGIRFLVARSVSIMALIWETSHANCEDCKSTNPQVMTLRVLQDVLNLSLNFCFAVHLRSWIATYMQFICNLLLKSLC